jgi:F-type H+-transporting ATPase subunit delta
VSVSVVGRRYARALLELGAEQGDLDRVVEEMGVVAGAWESSADLRSAIENPVVSHEAKRAIVNDLADRIDATATTRHALWLFVDRRRMPALPYIAATLRELADARKGVVRAEVTTAAPLSEGYYERLKAQLEKMTGKRVIIDRRTDPALIAGVVTRLGDRIIDGSLRTRLQSLREAATPAALPS